MMFQTFMCAISVFYVGQEPVVVTTTPFGECPSRSYCCPMNENKNIKFRLYTRDYPTAGIILNPKTSPEELSKTLTAAGASPALQTIVFVHGFLELSPGKNAVAIRDAYFERGNFNIIVVDWSVLSAGPWYITSRRNTVHVGRRLAALLKKLDTNNLLPLSGVHLIGFSLGAEVVGVTGKILRNPDGSPIIKRITGLDPAYPLYRFVNKTERLYKTDAEFVDVIHTDAGLLGYPTQIGHVDFYPNGGRSYQPGCTPNSIFREQMSLIDDYISCSHQRAWQYYAESIRNPRIFPASRCETTLDTLSPCKSKVENYLGLAASPYSRGKFYLTTNSKAPYGRGLL